MDLSISDIDSNNMDIVLLEKVPKIAVYSPPDKFPWDDAVTLALTYAEIDYDILFAVSYTHLTLPPNREV